MNFIGKFKSRIFRIETLLFINFYQEISKVKSIILFRRILNFY